ncbi:SpvB/TcaC N-terminal domain-containing protein [Enterobacter asburiae]
MENINTNEQVAAPSPLALPKGGGTIKGMGQVLSPSGSRGLSGMSLPLPISAGRGYAPPLSLSYSSGGSNGLFGQGWGVSVMRITRQTRQGVPQYNGEDIFIGPDGEELVAERDSVEHSVSTYGTVKLNASYTVTRYLSRVEGAFHRIEYWVSEEDEAGFWLIHSASGELHCLGKAAQARLANPKQADHVAEWWIQESLSPLGHQICYQYRPDCLAVALDKVCYGNVVATDQLLAWNNTPADKVQWLFTLVFDYGERGIDFYKAPPYAVPAGQKALPRQDLPVFYEYGFAQETHLLCRQVLMFHTFKELGDHPALITRLLPEYDEKPTLTQLVSARTVSYDEQGSPVSLPPLDLRYTTFSSVPEAEKWKPLEALNEIKDGQNYQLADLYGEGVPGLLYRDGTGWYYRAPERGEEADSIVYAPLVKLPVSPSLKGEGMALMDLTGNGKLDWVIQRPGLAGYFTLQEDRQWSTFIPFNSWPSEFTSSHAQLADLLGAGLQDLVLIGPRSVRLYINQRDRFTAPDIIVQNADVTLPVAGRDVTELVAFSDVLGSGQQHLISVRHDRVTCWANLGRGRFDSPPRILPILPSLTLDPDTFNPARLYLADIDGSGAVDILYAEPERIRLFRNQSGQRFVEIPPLPLPAGTHYDRLCQLNCVDLTGNGTTSLVLTVPHMPVRHWYYPFADQKPYLLSGMNNNMGADTQLHYRSSAQYWLDEKQESPQAQCHLPFPVQLLSRTETCDEITANRLTQLFTYRRGVYDGVLREFRGFGLVESRDTDKYAKGTGDHEDICCTALTRTWYHTGREGDEDVVPPTLMPDKIWMPYKLAGTRITVEDGDHNDIPGVPENGQSVLRQRLHRALQGRILRQELYGEDESQDKNTPYSVTLSRYQVRLIQPVRNATEPVVLPLPIETLSYYFERIPADPRITHQVQLRFDEFGTPLHRVDIVYPRRTFSELPPYPATLPEGGFAATEDEQQQTVNISESLSRVHHLTDPQCWRIGIVDVSRRNALVVKPARVPDSGFSLENLLQPGNVLEGTDSTREFAGQTKFVYTHDITSPALAALPDYTETAEFDEISLKAFDGIIDPGKLKNAGYIQTVKDDTLSAKGENNMIWVAQRGFTTRHKLEGFFLPVTTQPTKLTGATTLTWDSYFCGIISTKDAAGLEVSAQYDYRFILPKQITDVNDNTSEVLLDALGQVVATSFYGTENGGKKTGFSPVKDFRPPAEPVARHLDLFTDKSTAKQNVTSYVMTEFFSWMGKLDKANFAAQWDDLVKQHAITPDGYIRNAARDQNLSGKLDAKIAGVIKTTEQIPVYGAIFSADHYPDSPNPQQIAISVVFYDGFSRPLQTAQRRPPGDAYVRDSEGKLTTTTSITNTRWAVSGRVEYNNKGLPVRAYQPYFVNNWRYVTDPSLHSLGYADTHFYDPLEREIRVRTAKGYLRRQYYYPWFTVSEDENDTLPGI